MRLIVAWMASALAGALAFPVGVWIAAWFLGGAPSGWAIGILRIVPYVFGACLVFQLVYGGLLYVVLGALGWLNLPVVLLAYVVPITSLVWMGADVPKDIAMGVPILTCGVSLAVVGWLLIRT